MEAVLDSNFQSGERGTRMICTIPLKFMFHCTKSIFTKLEVKGESLKLGFGIGASSGWCWGVEHPKMVSLVCPLMTNAGVY